MSLEQFLNSKRPATGKVIPAGMNYLSDLIIRPGIEKKFVPLLLYRGGMYPGHAHRLWNMVLLMMASEAETISDGFMIFNNPNFSQLCGPIRAPTRNGLISFFGRLWDNPLVTKNIEGLADYVKLMDLGPCWLTPVDRLCYDKPYCAPWRKSLHPDAGTRVPKERGVAAKEILFYPYIAHDAQKGTTNDLVALVNQAVPKGWPDHVRADVCQDLIVAVLSGEIARGQVHDKAQRFINQHFKKNPMYWEGDRVRVSMDAPIGDSDLTLHDVVPDTYDRWSDQ